jgi:HEPN domain-containing protein
MRSRDHAEVLLRKAKEDEFTIEKLTPDPASPDEVIGFHPQQAVEKMLKAVRTHYAVPYPRIHDLTERVDLLRENNISFPEHLEEIDRLTPFATVFRYADLATQPPRGRVCGLWSGGFIPPIVAAGPPAHRLPRPAVGARENEGRQKWKETGETKLGGEMRSERSPARPDHAGRFNGLTK